MGKYLAIVALPFMLSCGGDQELSDKVTEPQAPQPVAATPTDLSIYCNGPPSIKHLFSAYMGFKELVERDSLDHPSVQRMYDSAEREYLKAVELHDSCRNHTQYMLANQLAINAINDLTEALTRQQELAEEK